MANVPAAVDIPGSAPQRPWWARVLRHFWSEHEAIKNHLTSFAIVIAGFWTYFIFTSLNQVKRAEAELAALRQEPVANIDITVSDVRLPGKAVSLWSSPPPCRTSAGARPSSISGTPRLSVSRVCPTTLFAA
jgi:hypothetical protein